MPQLQSLEHIWTRAERALFVSESMDKFAFKLLPMLGLAFECDWGTFWFVDENVRALRPIATWSREGLNAEDLERDTRNRLLSLSEGTAGHVWRSRKPFWSCDLTNDLCLPRSLDAHAVGLSAGVWVAIKTEHKVYGVLEFLDKSSQSLDRELLTKLEDFGIRLGCGLEKLGR